jgi:hypothetical protein
MFSGGNWGDGHVKRILLGIKEEKTFRVRTKKTKTDF